MSTDLSAAGPAESHWFRATCAGGAEALLAREVNEAGGSQILPSRGSVSFFGPWKCALSVCLWSRIAQRVALRMGEVPCLDARDLYEAAYSAPWEAWLRAGSTIAVHGSGRTEALRNTQFVAQCTKDAIVDRLRDRQGWRPNVQRRDPTLLVAVHVDLGRAWFGLELSSTPLFMRGYRDLQSEAPLKETLAASMLMASGWDGTTPLVDPMCGSGTIAIEGAWLAMQRAPGLGRAPSAVRWPALRTRLAPLWIQLEQEARARQLPRCPVWIGAADSSPRALELARQNIRAAGVERSISVRVGRAEQLVLDRGPGHVVTNPPYGERLADRQAALAALDALQELAAHHRDWQTWIILPDQLRAEAGLGGGADAAGGGQGEHDSLPLYNGAIPCRLLRL